MLPTRLLSNSLLFAAGAFGAMVAVLAQDVGAQDLDKLTAGRTWSAARIGNSTQPASFDWKADGSLCLRLGNTTGRCDDSGTWRIVDQRVCYQLTWWLKSYDLVSSCLSVEDLGGGRYEAKLPTGGPWFKFTVK